MWIYSIGLIYDIYVGCQLEDVTIVMGKEVEGKHMKILDYVAKLCGSWFGADFISTFHLLYNL